MAHLLRVNCPTCSDPMTPGFVQARSEVYFTEKPHKFFLAARGNDVVLTQHNNTSPTCTAYLCPVCGKVVIEYEKRL